MLWIVGTGRCGTKSAAIQCGGVHDPEPRIDELVADYAKNPRGEHRELERRLLDRSKLPALAVADLHQSFVIPLIREVDPEGRFLWLVRDPVSFAASMRTRPTDTGRPRAPIDTADEGIAVDVATRYWKATNELIGRHLYPEVKPTPTEALRVHVNRHDRKRPLTDEEIALVLEVLKE